MRSGTRDRELLGLVAPFLLWGSAFIVLYAGHGLACGLGLDSGAGFSAVRVALSTLFALFITAHIALAFWFWRRWQRGSAGPTRFVRLASLILAVSAIVTSAWTGFPVLVLSICT